MGTGFSWSFFVYAYWQFQVGGKNLSGTYERQERNSGVSSPCPFSSPEVVRPTAFFFPLFRVFLYLCIVLYPDFLRLMLNGTTPFWLESLECLLPWKLNAFAECYHHISLISFGSSVLSFSPFTCPQPAHSHISLKDYLKPFIAFLKHLLKLYPHSFQ